MSNTENNEPIKPATALQAVAKVALFAGEHRLPDPVSVLAYGEIHNLNIELNSRAALGLWLKAMGLAGRQVSDTAYKGNRHGYWVMARNWAGTGWAVQVKAIVVEPPVTLVEPLDEETVADLEEIAAGPALVSDATIAEAEQIVRMVAPMDLSLPQAECGCPIKGVGAARRVDHCQACYDRHTGVSA
jgi:hypothetical protein